MKESVILIEETRGSIEEGWLMIKKRLALLSLMILSICILGCEGSKKGTISGTNYYYPQNEKETEAVTEVSSVKAEFDANIYMIITNDMTKETMILQQMSSGKQYYCQYSLTTRFLDKYGNNMSVYNFDVGRLVTVNGMDSKGRIAEMQISDDVWEYENVVRYEIDAERGVFQIADTRYSFGESTFFVSDEKEIKVSDIKEDDELRIVGMNKEILSVSVTTGHGKVALENTEIFEGSFVQIGRRVFAEITGEMELEVPEGTYTITVANKGYGGSKEITVERNKTLVIDLDELKGEGPKKGNISFYVISAKDEEEDVNAVLKIDGKEVSHGEAVVLDYGIHTIQASGKGYVDFAKKLFVNSAEAEITIALEEKKSEDKSTITSSNNNAASADGSLAGSQAGSLTGGNTSNSSSNSSDSSNLSNNNNALTEELTSDYLSTFTELLGNLL